MWYYNSWHVKFLKGSSLQIINNATLILIPKANGACKLFDYRPTNLIHAFANLISKVLARRLQTKMELLGQRSIMDNFMYVQSLAWLFWSSKTPAFDNISSEFLVLLLKHHRFGSKWTSWIAIPLGTTTTSCKLMMISWTWSHTTDDCSKGTPSCRSSLLLLWTPLRRCLIKWRLGVIKSCISKLSDAMQIIKLFGASCTLTWIRVASSLRGGEHNGSDCGLFFSTKSGKRLLSFILR